MLFETKLLYLFVILGYCCYFSEGSEDAQIEDISNITSSCHPLDSCEGSLPAEGPAAGGLNRTCSCDSLCAVYGDCCRDAEEYKADDTQRHNALAYRCVNLFEYGDTYIRTQCRPGWQDDLGMEMCDRALLGREDTKSSHWSIRHNVAQDLPVTSLETGITYANIHCAICNDDISNLARWQPHIQCHHLPQNYSREHVRTHLHYNDEYEEWEVGGVEDEGNPEPCDVYPEAPESVKDGLLRGCQRAEASCATNWTDPHTQELCLNHMSRVYAHTGIHDVYRNRFCAICNYITESDISCKKHFSVSFRSFGFDLEHFDTNGYSNLLNLDTLFKENLPIETKIFVRKENGSVESIGSQLDSYTNIVSKLSDYPVKNVVDKVSTNISCHPLDSCKPLALEYPVAELNRTCRCDSLCTVYGDCCQDAEVYNSNIQPRSPLSQSCVHLKEYGDTYIRAQCRSDWQDKLKRELCDSALLGRQQEDSNWHIRQNVALDLPVTSLHTGITYANIHCAICNQDFGNLARWSTHLECYDLPKNYSREDVRTHLQYNNEYEEWEVAIEDDYPVACEVNPVAPESIIARGLLRQCERTEDSCATNWTDPHTHELCMNHKARVYALSGDSGVYRNKFCAICNYIAESDISCEKSLSGSLRSFGFDLGRFVTNGYSNLLNLDTLFYENLPIETLTDNRKGKGSVEQIEKKDGSYLVLVSELPDPNEDFTVDKNKQCISLKNGNTECWYKKPDYSSVVLSFISFTCLVLSAVCLIIHLVVFLIVPDLKNLSGKNLASYSIALLAADVTLILGYFGEPGEIECFIVAILKYYFFLASFTWLVIMSSDVCWTIMQSTKQLRVRSGSQRQKFITYTVCGWLLPIPLLCMAVILDTLDTNYLNGFPLGMIPEFGKFNCWFGQPQALLVFFGAPLALAMLLCTIFFIYSARIVYQTKLTVKGSSSGNQKAFMLYIRLALLSGITWISGLVAACINIVALKYIVMVLNAPQGLFILLAFTFTKKTRNGLQKTYARTRCCLFHCQGCYCCCSDKATDTRKISDSTNNSSDTQLSSV